MPTSHVPLIELTRGATLECQHFGSMALVDATGKLLAWAGDPYWFTFSRSTLKAFQALPLLEAGGHRQFGFTPKHLAMLCASHNGEDMHVAQTEEMLQRVGLDRSALRCGCHVPGIFSQLDVAPPKDLYYDERHNNCSGKHAGFLAYCVQHGLSTHDYVAPGHPLQQAIRRDVARAVGLSDSELAMGIDGCSAPNYAMPLASLAQGYARLASGIRDSEFGESFAALSDAMTTWPELVSGTGRNDLAFMRIGRGDWVTKIGADGVQVIASKSRGQALAIKVSDGSKSALYAASVEALEQAGWLDDTQRLALQPWRARKIVNAAGLCVGSRRPAFRLATA